MKAITAAITAAVTRAMRTPLSGPNTRRVYAGVARRTTVSSLVVTALFVAPVASAQTGDPGPVLGLITDTGVPVAVRMELPTRHLVYTPCGRLAFVEGGERVYQTPVVLDPGHGGDRDIGAVGRNGLPEKVLNLRVAQETQRALAERGIAAVLTRTADYATTLSSRARLADTLGAELMVSIHHNAPTPAPSAVPGIEVFVQSDSAESRRLGGVLWDYSLAALSTFRIAWSAAEDSGVLTVVNDRGNDAYGIIRIPETPTALIELGYISNPAEADLFATEVYVRVAAVSLARAIDTYLNTDRPGSGWVEPGRTFNPNPGLTQGDCIDPALS
jgi:N-acetylmuramoyl-L-alanine amidase